MSPATILSANLRCRSFSSVVDGFGAFDPIGLPSGMIWIWRGYGLTASLMFAILLALSNWRENTCFCDKLAAAAGRSLATATRPAGRVGVAEIACSGATSGGAEMSTAVDKPGELWAENQNRMFLQNLLLGSQPRLWRRPPRLLGNWRSSRHTRTGGRANGFLRKSRLSKQRLSSIVEKMHKDRAIKYLAEFPQEPSQEQAEQLLGLRSKPFPRDPLAKQKLELAKELLFQGPTPEDQEAIA